MVLIDAGTTCLEAGKALFGRKDVRIITHSVTLFEAARQAKAELLCVGGELAQSQPEPLLVARHWAFWPPFKRTLLLLVRPDWMGRRRLFQHAAL